MKNKIYIMLAIAIMLTFSTVKATDDIITVAIANYGPHASLTETISGFKEEMQAEGFIENQNVKYEISDVGFDSSLIAQMIAGLKAKKPKLMLVLTTPVAQYAKGKITDIPLIYTAVTDPVAAGLIQEKYKSGANITGSSNAQDMKAVLQFAKTLLPNARRIGLLYATAEANDEALLKIIKKEAKELKMQVMAIPIEKASDVPIRVKEFNKKVDFIYVGASGPIQPTLPAIAAEARNMKIPVINVHEQAVKDGMALASFGVNFVNVGKNAAKLAVEVLKGKKPSQLKPTYPKIAEHKAFVNKKLADAFNIKIPSNVEIVE